MRVPERILKQLGLVRVEEYRKLSKYADNQAKLAGDLVLECQRMSEEQDELSKQNESMLGILREIRGLVDKAPDLLG